MAIKENILGSIGRVANTHFSIRPILVNTLKAREITPAGQLFSNGAKTDYEDWVNSFNDQFYDMGTLVRLGTELELGLKYYYMSKMGYGNLTELEQDPNYQINIFQRLMPWSKNNLIELYKNSSLAYDLTSNSMFAKMQELMLYRHLYAHNSGILNSKFVDDYQRLTSKNILDSLEVQNWQSEDTYFFSPLRELGQFIEDSRIFFKELPE